MSADSDVQRPDPTQARSTRAGSLRGATPRALQAAKNVAARNHGRTAPLRRAFAERLDAQGPTTPLARMLRGGRGGSVRLRLYLSYIWLAASAPHELLYPARAWAELLDLDDPEGNGTRRIADAVRWLERHDFIEVEARSGEPNVIRLLSDDGSGAAYELPGAAYNRLRADPKTAAPHRYIQLPAELWTSGWMAVLSPAALAMLIVLLVQAGTNPAADIWIAPDYASATYMLAEETRTRGLRELASAGLVTIRRRQLVTTDTFDFRRFRNVYQLNLDALASLAGIPVSTPGTPLIEIAQVAPTGAVLEGFILLERALRQRLLEAEVSPGRSSVASLLTLARAHTLISDDLADQFTDLMTIRNKVAHGRDRDLTVAEALDFIKRAETLQRAIA